MTLAGTRRRVGLAVDSTTVVGLLLPDVLQVLDKLAGTASEGLVLTMPDDRAPDPARPSARPRSPAARPSC